MSYKCTVCHAIAPPGQPRLVHQTIRFRYDRTFADARKEIAAEHPVCAECKSQLDAGISLATLMEDHRPVATPLPDFWACVAEASVATPPPVRRVSF